MQQRNDKTSIMLRGFIYIKASSFFRYLVKPNMQKKFSAILFPPPVQPAQILTKDDRQHAASPDPNR